MLLKQTRAVTAKPLLSMSLKMACVHQDLGGLWCVILLFLFCFSFRSPSQNPSPWSLALATKPPCSPSSCGYPGAPAASLLQDSLVRRSRWILRLFSFPTSSVFVWLLFTLYTDSPWSSVLPLSYEALLTGFTSFSFVQLYFFHIILPSEFYTMSTVRG